MRQKLQELTMQEDVQRTRLWGTKARDEPTCVTEIYP